VEFLLDPTVISMSVEYLNPAVDAEASESEAEAASEEEYELADGSQWVPDVPEVVSVTLDYGDEELRITAQTGARCGPAAEEIL